MEHTTSDYWFKFTYYFCQIIKFIDLLLCHLSSLLLYDYHVLSTPFII